MKKLENLLDFEDFKANWKAKDATKTKRTEVGLDIVEEKKLNEELRQGVYDNFETWKSSFPQGTAFVNQNGYVVAQDSAKKELGKWNPTSIKGMHSDDFQYQSL
jgi:hypothetical protein